MAAPTKARQTAPAVDPYALAVQVGIDTSPSIGKRGTYVKCPAGVKFFAPADGRTYRLLFLLSTTGKNCKPPLVPGSLRLQLYFHTHAAVGPDNATYICAASMFAQRCASCDVYQERSNIGRRLSTEEYNAVKDFRSKNRALYLVHDLDGERDNVQIWDESTFLFDKYLLSLIADRPAYKLMAHPTQGLIVEVKGTKQSAGPGRGDCTHYNTIVMTAFSEAAGCKQISQKLLDKAKKIVLEDCLIMPPGYEAMSKLVRGHVADTNGQPETSDETPTGEGEEIIEDTEEATTEEATETTEEIVEEAPAEEIVEEEPVEEIVEEEPVEEEPAIAVGSAVTFKNGGKTVKGEVTEIDGDKAKVKSGKSMFKLGLDKLTLA